MWSIYCDSKNCNTWNFKQNFIKHIFFYVPTMRIETLEN